MPETQKVCVWEAQELLYVTVVTGEGDDVPQALLALTRAYSVASAPAVKVMERHGEVSKIAAALLKDESAAVSRM
jgi:hypothetical protein